MKRLIQIALLLVVLASLMIGCRPETVIEVVEVEVTGECETQEPEEEAIHEDVLPEDVLGDQRILAVYDDWVGFYDLSASPIETVSTDAHVEIFTGIPNHIIMKDAADVCVFDMDGSQLGCFDISEGAEITPVDQRILAVYDDWVGFYDLSASPIETVSTDARVEIFTSIPNHIIMKDAADVCVFDMDGSQLGCFDISEGAEITLADQQILAVYDDGVNFYDLSGGYIETVENDARVEIFTSIPNHIIMKDAANVCVFDMDGSQLGCFDISEGAEITPIP